MNFLPLSELFGHWREVYLEMLARGLSTEEALEQLSHLMLGDAPE
jgi:hypothetical protein